MNLSAISLIPLLLLCMPAFAEDQEQCEGPDTSTYHEVCVLSKETKAIDAELNKTYQAILKQYKKDGLMKQHKLLVEAQRAWVKFMNANCEFENEEIGGIYSISWIVCNNKMTSERLLYLEKFR
ncbi:MAG: lysozyme inhibitor LprI family protein [Betaproteobacteria bacterium]|nr:lysozyme inhibitor LprI family protein [Betaproteobacteria bacterium]